MAIPPQFAKKAASKKADENKMERDSTDDAADAKALSRALREAKVTGEQAAAVKRLFKKYDD